MSGLISVVMLLSPQFQIRDIVNTNIKTLTFACCGILDTKEQLGLFYLYTTIVYKLYYAF